MSIQAAKLVVRSLYDELDKAEPEHFEDVMQKFCATDYKWRGMYPFVELPSVHEVCEKLWKPFRHALTSIQRRQDIFMAGPNSLSEDDSIWVVSMGHLMGLHDNPWLNIPPTRRMSFLRYCEFTQVSKEGRVIQQAMWFDIPHLMVQAGVNPFPPQTGAEMVRPGPMTHSGLLFEEQDPSVSKKTLDTINGMITDLGNWENPLTLEEELALSWHKDMIWWGPTGIGSSYTIERYAKQHSGPFRASFSDRKFNGHVVRMAEGEFGGFFGWPNLTLTPTGDFMGMPATKKPCDMRVIDLYRRDGEKLAENWVFIDLLHFWSQQGLDVLKRLKYLSS